MGRRGLLIVAAAALTAAAAATALAAVVSLAELAEKQVKKAAGRIDVDIEDAELADEEAIDGKEADVEDGVDQA